MEAGNRAAGNGGKQNRENGVARAGVGIGDDLEIHGSHAAHIRPRQNDCHHCKGQHCIQKEAGEVVTGLEQNPDRRNGSDGNVHAADPHPGVRRQINGVEVHTDGDDGHDCHNARHACHSHRRVPAIDQEAEDDGDQDEQQGNHSDTGVSGRSLDVHRAALVEGRPEGARHDGSERRHHQNQGQVGENEEQHLRPLAHVDGDDFADGPAAVTHRGKQRAEVMDAAEENAADENPQRAGQPAEASRSDGTRDGAGTCD